MSKMRAVQVSRPDGPFEIVEREIPQPDAGSVRIKVQACGVCHSDSVIKERHWPGLQYPRVPGHEVVGVVDAVGAGVAGWTAGQQVGGGWHGGHCGRCDSCRRSIKGWYSGTSIDSQDTLKFSALTGVRSMNEVFPLERAAEAYDRMSSGKARFRAVLITGK